MVRVLARQRRRRGRGARSHPDGGEGGGWNSADDEVLRVLDDCVDLRCSGSRKAVREMRQGK
jgi:hypothetical protein